MTKDKKFKRLVRATAGESGERYQQVRQRLRPDQEENPDDVWLDQIEELRRPGWTAETALRARGLAQVALRLAERRPAWTGPPRSSEVDHLEAAARVAVRASADGNPASRAAVGAAIAAHVAAMTAELDAMAARGPVDRLLDVAAGRLDVALAARARLRDMDADRRDPGLVAAYSLLGDVAARLAPR